MTDEDLDYAWKFTGHPYLDGIIFGEGTRKHDDRILINVSDCPYTIIEEIEQKLNEIGYDAACQEMPNSLIKDVDLRIMASGPHHIFTKNTLPRFRERRLIIDETPIEFLYGFFTVRSKVKLKELYLNRNFEEDVILISSFLTQEDTLQLLHRLGIDEYILSSNKIFLGRSMFLGIKPFERVYQEFLKEYKFFGNNMTRNEIVTEMMEELKKKVWKEHETLMFDGIEYYE